MQDFGLYDLLWALGSILCVSIVGILWTQRESVAAIVSGHWRESLEKARQQKAAREALYGYATVNDYGADDWSEYRVMSRETGQSIPVSADLIPVSGTGIGRNTAADLLNLTEDQLVEALARRKDVRGKYAYSGKKIYALVGGNYNDFVTKVRRIRGDEADLQLEEPAHVTPIVGRRTNAQFETDPEFPYQAPAT